MCANSEGSGETARMRRLAWAFAGCLCDKYHNLTSWLNFSIPYVQYKSRSMKTKHENSFAEGNHKLLEHLLTTSLPLQKHVAIIWAKKFIPFNSDFYNVCLEVSHNKPYH